MQKYFKFLKIYRVTYNIKKNFDFSLYNYYLPQELIAKKPASPERFFKTFYLPY